MNAACPRLSKTASAFQIDFRYGTALHKRASGFRSQAQQCWHKLRNNKIKVIDSFVMH